MISFWRNCGKWENPPLHIQNSVKKLARVCKWGIPFFEKDFCVWGLV